MISIFHIRLESFICGLLEKFVPFFRLKISIWKSNHRNKNARLSRSHTRDQTTCRWRASKKAFCYSNSFSATPLQWLLRSRWQSRTRPNRLVRKKSLFLRTSRTPANPYLFSFRSRTMTTIIMAITAAAPAIIPIVVKWGEIICQSEVIDSSRE